MPRTETGDFREPNNHDRASFAATAIETYARKTNELADGAELPPLTPDNHEWWETVIADLLADLRHLSDFVVPNVDFFFIAERAEQHYNEELPEG